MQWILLGIIAIALLVLARYHPKIGFSVLFSLTALVGLIILFTENSGTVNRSKIDVNDIIVQNPVVTPAYGDGYNINARLNNKNTSSTLRELTLSLTMLDCEDETSNDCTVIGQKEKTINIIIPPAQSRDIEQFVAFDFAKPAKKLRWDILVTNTRN